MTKRNIRCHRPRRTCWLSQCSDHNALATVSSSLFQVERDHLPPCVGSLVSAWAHPRLPCDAPFEYLCEGFGCRDLIASAAWQPSVVYLDIDTSCPARAAATAVADSSCREWGREHMARQPCPMHMASQCACELRMWRFTQQATHTWRVCAASRASARWAGCGVRGKRGVLACSSFCVLELGMACEGHRRRARVLPVDAEE